MPEITESTIEKTLDALRIAAVGIDLNPIPEERQRIVKMCEKAIALIEKETKKQK